MPVLTEVYRLAQALEAAGLQPEREHPRVKSPGKTGPCLRVRLDACGAVTALEAVGDGEWPGLWTLMDGNQNSFPVIRLKEPLFDLPGGHALWPEFGGDGRGRARPSSDAGVREALLGVLRQFQPSAPTKGTRDLLARLRAEKTAELETLATADTGLTRLGELGVRFKRAVADPAEFVRGLAEIAGRQLEQGRAASWDSYKTLLVGKGPAVNGQRPDVTVQLALDLDDSSQRIYSQETRKRVIVALRSLEEAQQDRSTLSDGGVACAFTGQQAALQTGPFPKVRLPVLNKDFPLFSMFQEAPTNQRYEATGSEVVPVGAQLALTMQDALTWAVREERRGKTWRGVPSGKFVRDGGRSIERRDLLIAYVDGKPDIPANIADLFGSDPEEEGRQFEVDAKAVCDALDGIVRGRPESRLELFVVRRVSEGQAQVVLSEQFRVKELLRGAERWQQAAANLPRITVPVPRPAREGIEQRHPTAPYPAQVVRLLEYQWVRDGAAPRTAGASRQKPFHEAEGIGLSEVLDVMLHRPGKAEATTRRILRLTVQRVGPLLGGLFGALHDRRPERLDDYPVETHGVRLRETALQAASVLGISLYILGSRKEAYMEEAAFQLGQILSLADTLHKDYCTVVRDGSMPNTLVGNALLGTAQENPKRAVAELGSRLRVYVSWAKVAREPKAGEDKVEQRRIAVREARKTLQRYQPLAERLHRLGLPPRCDDLMKAHLLLGYLASVRQDEQGKEESDEQPE
jgi:hypothetical protein